MRRMLAFTAAVLIVLGGLTAPASAAASDSGGLRVKNQVLSPFLCLGAGSAVGQDVYSISCSTGDASMYFQYYGVGSDGLNYFRLRRAGTPACVRSLGTTVSGGGADLVLGNCNGDFRVLWHVEDLGSTWQVRNRSTHHCIGVSNLTGSAAQAACDSNSYTLLHFPLNEGGHYWPFDHDLDF